MSPRITRFSNFCQNSTNEWDLVIYDKGLEIKHQLAKGRIQASKTVTELLSSNILRVEFRLKNRQKVRNKLKFKAEGGSCTCDKFTHLQFIFPRLERFFNEELLSLLFKHEPSFTPSNRLDRLRKAMECSDRQRNKLNDGLIRFAYSELGREDPAIVEEILKGTGVTLTSRWLKMKEIKKARLSYKLSHNSAKAKSEESLETLYRELKTKLVGDDEISKNSRKR